ncbi:major capsid protein [Segatella buccae]|uniref:major capsid protein n=1 Tax=Segatella buccae TaxID=28126 RepID=UPI0022E01B71|nr:major capsid protein [Segatella buccae]
MDRVPKISVPRSTRPRNAFDLSQRHMFTSHVGMLLPVLSLDLMPHDHVEINASDFMRLRPVGDVSFCSMRGVYEFFFVPYSQLWHPFDQLVTGMKDFNSSLLSAKYSKSPAGVPSCKLSSIYKFWNDTYRDDNTMSDVDRDIFAYPRKLNYARIFDLLGYGNISMKPGSKFDSKELGDIKVTPLRALAYQKIYYDFYRNNTYEAGDVSKWNIDNIVGDVPANVFVDALELRYRNVGLDMLTNVRPTPLFGLDNVPGQFFTGSNPVVSANSTVNAYGWADKDKSVSSIGVASIRNAFALDKLLDVTMRAGKTYAEQMAAHFGVSVPEGRDHRVSYIGGFDSNFQFSDVTQVSGYGNDSNGDDVPAAGYLGKIASKGIGSGNGRVVYDAKEHGILMCIYSIVPDMYYDYTRVDPFVRKQTRGDFFVPEFENLGMQPLDAVSISSYGDTSLGGTVGWQPRYSEYKTALDINHGEFARNRSMEFTTVARARREDFIHHFDVSTLKIAPYWFDNLFSVRYDGNENTDCSFGGCYFNIIKVSDMSVDGLPKL